MSEETKSNWGGKRDGAGRPSKGYKMVSIRMTEEEKTLVKEFLKNLREQKIDDKIYTINDI